VTGRIFGTRPIAFLGMLLLSGCGGVHHPTGGAPKLRTLSLARGDFPVRLYEPTGDARGVIVFGSGDGGWKSFEDRSCKALSCAGWYVVGWDCQEYADPKRGPYDRDTLGRDLASMARLAAQAGLLLYAGYSTGAEQAVVASSASTAAKGGTLLPSGLLLIAPGSRGRCGITFSDLMGFTPRGPGSFSLVDLAPELGTMSVVQIHGTLDPLDSTVWLGSLRGKYQLISLPGTGHFFGDADNVFLEALTNGASWLSTASRR
jgi:type IV secretory pathway VirJ component